MPVEVLATNRPDCPACSWLAPRLAAVETLEFTTLSPEPFLLPPGHPPVRLPALLLVPPGGAFGGGCVALPALRQLSVLWPGAAALCFASVPPLPALRRLALPAGTHLVSCLCLHPRIFEPALGRCLAPQTCQGKRGCPVGRQRAGKPGLLLWASPLGAAGSKATAQPWPALPSTAQSVPSAALLGPLPAQLAEFELCDGSLAAERGPWLPPSLTAICLAGARLRCLPDVLAHLPRLRR